MDTSTISMNIGVFLVAVLVMLKVGPSIETGQFRTLTKAIGGRCDYDRVSDSFAAHHCNLRSVGPTFSTELDTAPISWRVVRSRNAMSVLQLPWGLFCFQSLNSPPVPRSTF